jgi:hypothetical protein
MEKSDEPLLWHDACPEIRKYEPQSLKEAGDERQDAE